MHVIAQGSRYHIPTGRCDKGPYFYPCCRDHRDQYATDSRHFCIKLRKYLKDFWRRNFMELGEICKISQIKMSAKLSFCEILLYIELSPSRLPSIFNISLFWSNKPRSFESIKGQFFLSSSQTFSISNIFSGILWIWNRFISQDLFSLDSDLQNWISLLSTFSFTNVMNGIL